MGGVLAIELQELNAEDFDLSLPGFDEREFDWLLAIPEEEPFRKIPRHVRRSVALRQASRAIREFHEH